MSDKFCTNKNSNGNPTVNNKNQYTIGFFIAWLENDVDIKAKDATTQ